MKVRLDQTCGSEFNPDPYPSTKGTRNLTIQWESVEFGTTGNSPCQKERNTTDLTVKNFSSG